MLSFLVCVVMFPSSVFFIYAEVMKQYDFKKILPERAAFSFPHSFSLTHTLSKLESVSSVCQFSLIENSLGQNQWELIGSGSVFLRNVFPGAQGFYV